MPPVSRRQFVHGALLVGAATAFSASRAWATPLPMAADPATVEAQLAGLAKPIYIFETAVPAAVTSDAGSTLSISDDHAKIGTHSLRWDYSAGSSLRVETPLNIGTAEAGQVDYFAVWLYNDIAVEGDLLINVGTGGAIEGSQRVHLSFTGWRAVWLRYRQDFDGVPTATADRLTFVAPPSAGSMWIDQLVTNVSLRSDRPTPDFQLPTIAPELQDSPNFHWMGLQTYWNLQTEPGFPSAAVTAAHIANATVVKDRLIARLRGNQPFTDAALTAQESAFTTAGIPLLADPAATGADLRPATTGSMIYDTQLEVIPVQFQGPLIEISNGQKLRPLWETIGLKAAQTWHAANRAGDAAAAERAGQLVLRLLVHMLDQGWAAGSGQGTIHHIGYTFRSWVKAVPLVEPLLRERGLWQQCAQALEWYVGTGRLTYDFSEPRHRSGLIDVLNTLLEGMLVTCFVSESATDQAARLLRFQQWIGHAYSYTPGLDGGFKPDGTMYHHNGPYTLYGRDALSGSIPVVMDVVGTSFALDDSGQRVLTEALRHQVLLAQTLDYPFSQCGRQQTGTFNIRSLINAHALIARRPLDGSQGLDADHAATYRRLLPPDATSTMLRTDAEFAAAGIEPAPAPTGHWAFPYSATALARDDQWQVTVRGHNRYIWSTEIYDKNNLYGRYQTYGQITVLADVDGDAWSDLLGNGITQPGYDWNFIPGATTKTLPFADLGGDLTGVVEVMPLSESAFGGSGTLGAEAVLFGMELKEHPAFDASHTARISVLAVGDRAIALGSAISNDDGDHPTRTTLFQVCPEVMTGAAQVAAGDGWLTDPAGNGYVVLAGPAPTHSVAAQTTPDQSGQQQATRSMALGYLDHGAAPSGAGYAYVIAVQAGADETAALAAADGEVAITQRDEIAHVVTHTPSNITGHVIFEPETQLATGSLVASANRQLLVLSRPAGRGTRWSFTDPDLHLYTGRDEDQYDGDTYVGGGSPYTRPWQFNDSIPTDSTVTLRGRWRPATDADRAAVRLRNRPSGDTDVTFTSVHGRSVDVTLIRVSTPPGNDGRG